MITAWTKNIRSDEEKERFQNTLLGSKEVFNRLIDLLDEKEKELDRSNKNLNDYDSPNWAYRQAHKNGYSSALSFIKTLIDLDQQT